MHCTKFGDVNATSFTTQKRSARSSFDGAVLLLSSSIIIFDALLHVDATSSHPLTALLLVLIPTNKSHFVRFRGCRSLYHNQR
jgi:hypothetical protein